MRQHINGLNSSCHLGKALQFRESGGAKQDRTADLYNAIVALYQLSYDPRMCERNIRGNALTRQSLN